MGPQAVPEHRPGEAAQIDAVADDLALVVDSLDVVVLPASDRGERLNVVGLGVGRSHRQGNGGGEANKSRSSVHFFSPVEASRPGMRAGGHSSDHPGHVQKFPKSFW